MAFRFVHTGDLHLDSPFVGLTAEAPPGVGHAPRGDHPGLAQHRRPCARGAGRLPPRRRGRVRARQPDAPRAARLPGRARPARRGRDRLVRRHRQPRPARWLGAVGRLARARAPVPGPGGERPARRARRHGDRPRLRHQLPPAGHHGQPGQRFRRDADAPYAVGLCTPTSAGWRAPPTTRPAPSPDLRASGMDYWALGHIHRHHVVSPGQPTVVYCGNPQGRDQGETDPRGCYVVTVDDAGRAHPSSGRWTSSAGSSWTCPSRTSRRRRRSSMRSTAAVDEARVDAGRSIVARVTLTGAARCTPRWPGPASVGTSGPRPRSASASPSRSRWIESLREQDPAGRGSRGTTPPEDFVGDLLRRLDAPAAARVRPGRRGAPPSRRQRPQVRRRPHRPTSSRRSTTSREPARSPPAPGPAGRRSDRGAPR